MTYFILLAHIDKLDVITIYFETECKNTKKLINLSEFALAYTRQFRGTLLGLHCFIGCDSRSAFRGRRRIRPIQITERMPLYVPALVNLGESWSASDEAEKKLEHFTRALHGKSNFQEVDDVRLSMVKEKCNDKPHGAARNRHGKIATMQEIPKTAFKKGKLNQVRIWKLPLRMKHIQM